MVYILDSSFVGAVIIPDEKNLYAEKLYRQIKTDDTKLAPCLFFYEMTNIFVNLIRRKRYARNDVMKLLPVLSALEITVDSETGPGYMKKLLRLCSDYALSSYDAAYLELAERKEAVLCTLDESLWTAAKKHGIAVLR